MIYIISSLLLLIIFIMSVVVHEVSHGKVANYLGDPTAELAGRLTLNPIPHIDLVGSIIIPFLLFFSHAGIMFGWAKPVPIDTFNLRKPRRDAAIISMAGPGANIALAVIASVLLHFSTFIDTSWTVLLGLFILVPLIKINCGLAIFNLIP